MENYLKLSTHLWYPMYAAVAYLGNGHVIPRLWLKIVVESQAKMILTDHSCNLIEKSLTGFDLLADRNFKLIPQCEIF